jgi:hypothetical protein
MNAKERLRAIIEEATPRDLLTLHALVKKLDGHYAHPTVEGALRTLIAEGAVVAYEHPSFPQRAVYTTPAKFETIPPAERIGR